jgi:osmotically-inducible protein OsmY
MSKTTDIRAAVEAELKFDPLVDRADIHVANVNGDVALNGTVPSYPQYLEAATATQRVSGVKNVFNHLEVALPDGDFRDDTVTLTGTVGYGAERAAAERAVAGLTGVRLRLGLPAL